LATTLLSRAQKQSSENTRSATRPSSDWSRISTGRGAAIDWDLLERIDEHAWSREDFDVLREILEFESRWIAPPDRSEIAGVAVLRVRVRASGLTKGPRRGPFVLVGVAQD